MSTPTESLPEVTKQTELSSRSIRGNTRYPPADPRTPLHPHPPNATHPDPTTLSHTAEEGERHDG